MRLRYNTPLPNAHTAKLGDSGKREVIMAAVQERRPINANDHGKLESGSNDFEVFKKKKGAVDFRSVPWIQVSIIFLKSR